MRTQPVARCMDISSASVGCQLYTRSQVDLRRRWLTHLGVVLQCTVIDGGEYAHAYQTPVWKVNGGEMADVLALNALDPEIAIAD